MSWILLEGLDRSGKSSVAEYYRNQGYDVVHMSAPDKRYFEPGYSGPSYLEEIVEVYNVYAGKNVVFDRTVYGEMVWPQIFNRMPLLNEEDYEYLIQLEYNQDVERYLLTDSDIEAHWKRCSNNKEPINRVQFMTAGRLYDKLVSDFGFVPKELHDFQSLAGDKNTSQSKLKKSTDSSKSRAKSSNVGTNDTQGSASTNATNELNNFTMEDKLNRANAIRTLLSSKIIKKKDAIYEDLEKDIRSFLEDQLQGLFTAQPDTTFTTDEVQILKLYAQRIKAKME